MRGSAQVTGRARSVRQCHLTDADCRSAAKIAGAMPEVRVEKISEPCKLGEGPHWDADRKLLYFVDIPGKRVHKYDPATRTQKSVNLDEPVSLVIPVKGEAGKFVITQGRKVVLMTWDGESSTPAALEVIATVDEEEARRANRINDGKTDASGTLWAGTMPATIEDVNNIPEVGTFFSLSKDRSTKTHLTGVRLSNGIAFSPDNKTMYYIDTPTRKVDAFDFDITQGKIGSRRAVFDLQEHGLEGYPDGQTIDADGNLWIAVFGLKQVIQVDPRSGKLLQRVDIPAQNVTSVAWGGAGLDELFVTTTAELMSPLQLEQQPDAGCTFRVTGLGARGLPAQPVAL